MLTKILRIFVYVVLRLLGDLLKLIISPISLIILLIANGQDWAEYGRFFKCSEEREVAIFFCPFYTTIKTVREIWRS